MDKQVELQTIESAPRCCGFTTWISFLCTKSVACTLAVATLAFLSVTAFLLGRVSAPAAPTNLPDELLRATATHSGADMAVATGRIDEETEGIYFLDYKTGDLTCWVYYSRFMRFGAKYMCNVTEQLAATKNAEYLLVTGIVQPPPASSNNRPAAGLVYVVDTKSGQFAAYTVAAIERWRVLWSTSGWPNCVCRWRRSACTICGQLSPNASKRSTRCGRSWRSSRPSCSERSRKPQQSTQ